MIGGGLLGTEGGECSFTKRVVGSGDFNNDGLLDQIIENTYYQKECKGQGPDKYIEFAGGRRLGKAQQLADEKWGSLREYTDHFQQFVAHSPFKARAKNGAVLFQTDDLVEGPFGPFTDKARGRIHQFVFELDDANNEIVRIAAEILTPYGSDIFDLFALTLVSPVMELDKEADRLIRESRDSRDFRRRAEILLYAPFHRLHEAFQKEVKDIEKKLALEFEEQIDKLSLDREGKRTLLDKVGEKLGFQQRASSLAWEAREKREESVPTNTIPHLCP